MLATAVALGESSADGGARVASWRQIVDVLAQAGSALDAELRDAALAQLTDLRSSVPVNERRLAAASLAGRTRDTDIIALFASDTPAIAAPLLARTELSADEWCRAVPVMPPASRNILRNRRDLPAPVTDLLARFAPGDLALPNDVRVIDDSKVSGVTQIRDLVDRIAAYRTRSPVRDARSDIAALSEDSDFEFETMVDGTIDWVNGCAREAIIGMAISHMAEPGQAGVDGQAVGAVRRRAPFRDARMLVAGAGTASGDWLISGTPLFNPRDGRFCGYRGVARRPQPGERASDALSSVANAQLPLRQLVHELRTPLNAIQGFAEMIDQQLLGPADWRYRDRARAILVDVDRLVTMVDDLDANARIDSEQQETAKYESADGANIAAIAMRLCAAHKRILSNKNIDLVLTGADEANDAALAAALADRMIARLVAAVVGVAADGETIDATLDSAAGRVMFSIVRPVVLHGLDERMLLDPSYGPDGEWPDAPLMGLGFTLRLVARLARQAGSKFVVSSDRFTLSFPGVLGGFKRGGMVGPAGLEPAT